MYSAGAAAHEVQLAEYAAHTSTGSAGQMSDDVSGVSAHWVFLLAVLHDAFTLLGSLLPEGHHAEENARMQQKQWHTQ